MKMTLNEALAAFEGIVRVGETKMSAKIAYAFQKNARTLKIEFDAYEKARLKLAKSLGDYIPKTNTWEVKEENRKEFFEQIDELRQEEIDVKIHTISLDKINFEIAPNDFAVLHFMIDESVEKHTLQEEKDE